MGTRSGQGAPGVKDELIDNSSYATVPNTIITGGFVGFAPRGELNTILDIADTGSMDTVLGNGYNNPKFNQALYGARAVLENGGAVQFIRPYGETVITDHQDPNYATNQELKTDAFIVTYDWSVGAKNSIGISHFASSRYISDAASSDSIFAGTEREIFTAARALAENTNKNFALDCASAGNKIPLFAIMNTDPTVSNRSDLADVTKATFAFTSTNVTAGQQTAIAIDNAPAFFTIGDSVIFVAGNGATLPSNILSNVAYKVSQVTGNSVTIDVYTVSAGTGSSTLINISADVTISGNDYLQVKTAAVGTSAQYTQVITLAGTPTTGDLVTTLNSDGSFTNFQFIKLGESADTGNSPVLISLSDFSSSAVISGTTTSIPVPSANTVFSIGDAVKAVAGTGTLPTGITAGNTYLVTGVTASAVTLGVTTSAAGTGTCTLSNLTGTVRNLKSAFVNAGFGSAWVTSDTAVLTVTVTAGPKIAKTGTPSFISSSNVVAVTVGTAALVSNSETAEYIIDSDIGRSFVGNGLATQAYIDTNFDGSGERVYILNTAGVSVASHYVFVNYYFAGTLYSFGGTIGQQVVNTNNLFIGNAAKAVASGWQFVLNTSDDLAYALEDSQFDLSNSVSEGQIRSLFQSPAFNPIDPAVVQNVIWSYDPRKNGTSAVFQNAWQLFLNKDVGDADALFACGTAISNLFVRGQETIDYNVMNVMLDVCEKRKDCFSIFDGIDEPNVKKALMKYSAIGSQGDVAHWGAIYDGRSLMNDTTYTQLTDVSLVKSVELARIITSNRAGGIWWLPPAGPTGTLQYGEKFTRSYGYGAADASSDIALLYDSNVNPTRVTRAGSAVYGDKSMQKRETALDRIHVIMLIAGIHKQFNAYLDGQVFRLNTPQLRSETQSTLQSRINLITGANPAGLYSGVVICDKTNNTDAIIAANELIVDLQLVPTKGAEFITLRTTVEKNGNNMSVKSSQIIGG